MQQTQTLPSKTLAPVHFPNTILPGQHASNASVQKLTANAQDPSQGEGVDVCVWLHHLKSS